MSWKVSRIFSSWQQVPLPFYRSFSSSFSSLMYPVDEFIYPNTIEVNQVVRLLHSYSFVMYPCLPYTPSKLKKYLLIPYVLLYWKLNPWDSISQHFTFLLLPHSTLHTGSTRFLWIHCMVTHPTGNTPLVHLPSFPQRRHTSRGMEDHLQGTFRVNRRLVCRAGLWIAATVAAAASTDHTNRLNIHKNILKKHKTYTRHYTKHPIHRILSLK